MQYGDVVIHVNEHEGFQANALVFSHHQQDDTATLCFLHPGNNTKGLKPPVVTVLHGVKRLGGQNKIGWKPVSETPSEPAEEEIEQQVAGDIEQQVKDETAEDLKEPVATA
jgi:hypothetical protein